MELIEGCRDALPAEGLVHHIPFTVDDIDAEFARIQSLGSVELIDQEIVTLPNGSRYFFTRCRTASGLNFSIRPPNRDNGSERHHDNTIPTEVST